MGHTSLCLSGNGYYLRREVTDIDLCLIVPADISFITNAAYIFNFVYAGLWNFSALDNT